MTPLSLGGKHPSPTSNEGIENPEIETKAVSHISEGVSLFVLPLELRHVIYDQLLIEGSMAILRTSKAIRDEAIQRIYKLGTLRLNFGSDDRVSSALRHLSPRVVNQIENVELRINVGLPSWGAQYQLDLRPIALLNCSNITRKSCVAVIDYGVFDLRRDLLSSRNSAHQALKTLVGFQDVKVKLGLIYEFGKYPQHYYTGGTFDAYSRSAHLALRDILEPALGHARFDVDEIFENRCLEFRPRWIQFLREDVRG